VARIVPSIYELKPRFQSLLRPTVDWLAARRVTPNTVTLAAFALSSIIGGLLLAFPQSRVALLLVPAALFLRMAMNAIDGLMAREHDMKSRLGTLLNELTDVAADALVYLPVANVAGIRPPLLVTFVVLGILGVTMVR
jgi:CDP-diacylglycerol---glycerol-3-phosphate 3-phosphatidyltransferase